MYINEAAKLIQHLGRWRGYVNRKLRMSGLPLLSTGGTSRWTLGTLQHEMWRCREGTCGKTREPLQEISRFPCSSQGKSWERNPHLPTSPPHTPSHVFSWHSGSELTVQILPICILDLYIFVYGRAQTRSRFGSAHTPKLANIPYLAAGLSLGPAKPGVTQGRGRGGT